MSETSSHTSYRLIQCLQTQHSMTLFQSSHIKKKNNYARVSIWSQFPPSHVKVLLSVISLVRHQAVQKHWSRTPRPDRHLTDTDQISVIQHWIKREEVSIGRSKSTWSNKKKKKNLNITDVCNIHMLFYHSEYEYEYGFYDPTTHLSG